MAGDADRVSEHLPDQLAVQGLRRCADGGEPALVQQGDAVGVKRSQVQVVQYRQDPGLLLVGEAAGDGQHRVLVGQVQRRGGFVQQ